MAEKSHRWMRAWAKRSHDMQTYSSIQTTSETKQYIRQYKPIRCNELQHQQPPNKFIQPCQQPSAHIQQPQFTSVSVSTLRYLSAPVSSGVRFSQHDQAHRYYGTTHTLSSSSSSSSAQAHPVSVSVPLHLNPEIQNTFSKLAAVGLAALTLGSIQPPTQIHCESDIHKPSKASIPSLISTLTSPATTSASRCEVLKQLNELALWTDNHEDMLKLNIIPILSSIIVSAKDLLISKAVSLSKDAEDEVELAISLMADLSMISQYHPIFLESKVIGLCADMLQAIGWKAYQPAKWYQIQGSNCSVDESKLSLWKRNTTKELVRCVSSLTKNVQTHDEFIAQAKDMPGMLATIVSSTTDADTRRFAMLGLAALCNKQAADVVRDRGIQLFVQFSSKAYQSDEALQWYTMGGLRRLAKDESLHAELVKHGALTASNEAMRKQDKENTQAEKFAVLALVDLMCTKNVKVFASVQDKCVHLDIFKSMGSLLDQSKSLEIQKTICSSLQRILTFWHDKNAVMPSAAVLNGLISSNALNRMVEFLQPKADTKLHIAALGCIGALSLYVPTSLRTLDSLTIVSLIFKDLHHSDPQVVTAALQCLSCMKLTASNHEISLLQTLVKLKAPKNVVAARSIATIVADLSRDHSVRTEICQEGALAMLLDNLKDPVYSSDQLLVENTLRLLYNLTTTGISRIMMVQKGGLSAVAIAATSPDHSVRKFAHYTCATLAENFEYALKLVEAGVIPSLVESVVKNEAYAKQSLLALAELTNIPDLLTQLAKHKAGEAFLIALKRAMSSSSSTEEQHYAALAICNLASNALGRKELKDAGALGILSTLSRSAMAPAEIMNIAAAAIANITDGETTLVPIGPIKPPVSF